MGEKDNNLEIWIRISQQIGELQASVQSVLQQLVSHENRITALEQSKAADKKDWKADLLMLLARAILIGGVSIAALCGAGGLLQQILGK